MMTPEQLIRTRSQEPGSTLHQPLEYLTACHRRIEQRLDALERVAQLKAIAGQPEDEQAVPANCCNASEGLPDGLQNCITPISPPRTGSSSLWATGLKSGGVSRNRP
jgi:hypothetical protein